MVFHMSKKSFPIIGTKSSLLWDEDTDAWVYISGKPHQSDDPRAYYKIIPTLFRGVDLRASAIANLPWALMKGETEVETTPEPESEAAPAIEADAEPEAESEADTVEAPTGSGDQQSTPQAGDEVTESDQPTPETTDPAADPDSITSDSRTPS